MKKNQKGYIAISMVLILLAVLVTLTISSSRLAIGEGQSSFAQNRGDETLAFVEGCVEDVLQKAHDSDTYSGNTTITRPEGTCTVSTINKVGSQWTFTVSTQATDYKRSIEIIINRAPPAITLISWKEL